MTATPEERMQKLLEEFGVAMLVTRTPEGQLRGRPMVLAEAEPDGTLWFLTGGRSGKMEELEQDDHVVVTMQSKRKFLSISGTAAPDVDRERLARIWKPEFQAWFPGGQDDPDLVLLRMDGEDGEYWDNSGASGVKYLIEAGKALLTGSRPHVADDPKVHAKVHL